MERLLRAEMRERREQGKLRRSVLMTIVTFGIIIAILLFPHRSRGAEFTTCAGSTCITGDVPSSAAKIIQLPPHKIDEEREARWLMRCDPRIVQDDYGVERYVYAPGVRGCEFGKDK